MLPVVPMFHVNAWGTPYAAAMVGSTLVLPGPGLDGASLVQLIDNYKVTVALWVYQPSGKVYWPQPNSLAARWKA